jgi:hypothetical protein
MRFYKKRIVDLHPPLPCWYRGDRVLHLTCVFSEEELCKAFGKRVGYTTSVVRIVADNYLHYPHFHLIDLVILSCTHSCSQ